MLTIFAAGLAARLLQEVALPEWVLALATILGPIVAWLVLKVPALAAFGKRNVVAILAGIVAVPAALNGSLPTPGFPEWSGDIGLWLMGLDLFIVGVFGWWVGYMKTWQVIYDLFTRQIGPPDPLPA